jgi:hypothetical protein
MKAGLKSALRGMNEARLSGCLTNYERISHEECKKAGKEAWKSVLPAFLPSSLIFCQQTGQTGNEEENEPQMNIDVKRQIRIWALALRGSHPMITAFRLSARICVHLRFDFSF